jgi:hypothetical protein
MATKPHPAHLSPCVLELSGEDVTDSGSKYKHVYDIELREGGSVVGKSGKSVIKDGAWDHEGNVRSLATSPVRVLRRFICGSAAGHVLVSSLRVRQISFDLVDNDGSSDQGGKVRSFVLSAGPGGSCFVFGTVIFW